MRSVNEAAATKTSVRAWAFDKVQRGATGPERAFPRWAAVPETTGEHHLEARFPESDTPDGKYQVGVREQRPATVEDRERARAEALFA